MNDIFAPQFLNRRALNYRVLLLSAVSFLGLIGTAAAQDINVLPKEEKKPHKRGQVYFQWGYNRDWYSRSTIHVYRNDANPANSYDFTLYNAKAHDKPDMWRWWQPERLTIPQYDMYGGYMFNDKNDFGIEVAWNHLKYVVTDWQNIYISGQIHGTAINRTYPLDPDTLHLQHTNGNNYLLVSLVKRQQIYNGKYFQVSAIAKAGVGPMISYTIDTILGDYDPGYFHYHGWVAAVSAGVRVSFLKYFYLQSDMQGAYADYTNTKLGYNHLGRSTQHFYSLQWTYLSIGGIVPIGKK